MFFKTQRIAFVIVGLTVFSALNGCSNHSQLAPVVNAWYQPRPDSSGYVVRNGDTIYSIAWAFGLDYRSLAEANHLNPPYALSPGQHLVMTYTPAGQAPATAVLLQTQQPPVVQANYQLLQRSESSQSRQSVQQLQSEQPTHFVFTARWNWPAQGRVIQGFSRDPSGHPGISISGRLGSIVRASAAGTVVYSGDGVRGYGNLIIIKHNASYLSAYAFNQQNWVTVGEHVQAGSVIARMGQNDAGRTLLYFEIRRDGRPVNPLTLLR